LNLSHVWPKKRRPKKSLRTPCFGFLAVLNGRLNFNLSFETDLMKLDGTVLGAATEMATPWNVPLLGRLFGTAALQARGCSPSNGVTRRGAANGTGRRRAWLGGGDAQEATCRREAGAAVVTEAPAIAARRLSAWSRKSGNGSYAKRNTKTMIRQQA
jgi:hypothetical protein